MATTIGDVLRSAWFDFLNAAQLFLPHLIAMLILFLAGWLIAWLLSFVLRHVLRWARFDALADRTGATGMLKRATLPSASEVVASVVFWVVLAGFILSGLSALGFAGTQMLASEFLVFLPRLGLGIVILAVGLIAANFAWRATLLGAVNSNLPSARLLSGAVRWLIVAFTIAMALEQIGVAKTMMLTAFAIAFGAVMLGVGIAIGIGGGPVARRLIERQFPEAPESGANPPDPLSHL